MKSLTVCLIIAVCSMQSGCNDFTSTATNNKPDTSEKQKQPWAMLGFIKADSVNPVLVTGNNSFKDPITKKNVLWEEKDVFNPAVVIKDGKVYMLYENCNTNPR